MADGRVDDVVNVSDGTPAIARPTEEILNNPAQACMIDYVVWNKKNILIHKFDEMAQFMRSNQK